MALPMPDDAPVISAFLPDRSALITLTLPKTVFNFYFSP
jgi:hypothetical protein